jgi:hypothetical protein
MRLFRRWTASSLVALLVLARDLDLPAPTVYLEHDGDVAIDWDLAQDCTLTVSLHPQGRGGGWSALIGGWTDYGTFGDIDHSVNVAIALGHLARKYHADLTVA